MQRIDPTVRLSIKDSEDDTELSITHSNRGEPYRDGANIQITCNPGGNWSRHESLAVWLEEGELHEFHRKLSDFLRKPTELFTLITSAAEPEAFYDRDHLYAHIERTYGLAPGRGQEGPALPDRGTQAYWDIVADHVDGMMILTWVDLRSRRTWRRIVKAA